MGTLILSDATTKTMAMVAQTGLTAQSVAIDNTPAMRLSFTGKHTLSSSDPYSKSRDLQSVVKQRVDPTTNKQIEVGCNLTVWASNHPNITAIDRYDVIAALLNAILGTSTALDSATKARIDKLYAAVNLVV